LTIPAGQIHPLTTATLVPTSFTFLIRLVSSAVLLVTTSDALSGEIIYVDENDQSHNLYPSLGYYYDFDGKFIKYNLGQNNIVISKSISCKATYDNKNSQLILTKTCQEGTYLLDEENKIVYCNKFNDNPHDEYTFYRCEKEKSDASPSCYKTSIHWLC